MFVCGVTRTSYIGDRNFEILVFWESNIIIRIIVFQLRFLWKSDDIVEVAHNHRDVGAHLALDTKTH